MVQFFFWAPKFHGPVLLLGPQILLSPRSPPLPSSPPAALPSGPRIPALPHGQGAEGCGREDLAAHLSGQRGAIAGRTAGEAGGCLVTWTLNYTSLFSRSVGSENAWCRKRVGCNFIHFLLFTSDLETVPLKTVHLPSTFLPTFFTLLASHPCDPFCSGCSCRCRCVGTGIGAGRQREQRR